MIGTFLRLAVSVAVLAVLFALMDTEAILIRLRGADAGWLAAAVCVLTILTFLMARRWQLTAIALGFDLSFRTAVSEYYIAQWLNLVLPGGMAGDAARAVRLRKGGDLKRAAQTVIIERLIGQSTLFMMMFVGFTVALLVPSGIPWPVSTWAWLALGVAVAVTAVLFARREGRAARFIDTALRLMRRPQQVVLSALIAVLISVAFYACARATGTVLPVAALFTLIPLLLTAMLIPFSVGGWGWREGAAAALFPLTGALPSAGVAAGIAYGAMMLVAALPAVVLLVLSPRKGRSADQADEPEREARKGDK